jgi:hypothetical protein
MPAGDKKYLLVAKRLLIFTSSSVVVPLCCSSRMDDRWYNVPRRPLTGLSPLPVLPPMVLTAATSDDAIFAAEEEILKKFIGKYTVIKMFCLAVLALSMFPRFKFMKICIYDLPVYDGPVYGDFVSI